MGEAAQDIAVKGSAETWLDAAYATLLDKGVDAVRIMNLSKALNLSRTSFYWFFKDRDALLAELLSMWRRHNTQSLVARAEAYADTIAEAVLNVFDCWLDPELFDSRLEVAVRSWAQQSPDVAEAVGQADEQRVAALGGMFAGFGFEPLATDVRARAIYVSQIGYISMHVREPIETRLLRLPEYVEVFCGVRPTTSEMKRFCSRHGVAMPQ